MPDPQAAQRGEPIAIVGIACRFPDASDHAEFLDLVLSQRRAFRRLRRGRPGLTAPGLPEPACGHGWPAGTAVLAAVPGEFTPGGGAVVPCPDGLAAAPGSVQESLAGTEDPVSQPAVRAGLLEGWRFDQAAFGVTRAVYQATDPAQWLALETAARALADGGFPGGQGLSRDRTGVIIGNTLTGEVSRALALRSRWPYVSRVISSALADQRLPPGQRAALLAEAEARFLASFPEPGEPTLAGSLPSVIADRICGYFGFRGGGHAVDSAHSSSLLAVAAACSALTTRDLDAAVAGGVDISLDPFELAGLASMGVLAGHQMRVYDARPTGFWPGEGCGLVVLMRAADARVAGLPAYAQIAGWGTSSAGNPALTKPGSGSLLLALRRAYERAGIDPADVQLVEGDGTGTASGDLAELTSLADIRRGAATLAAIGSVKANIGHTKAAAGVAGLIKTALAVAAGVIPPVTGCTRAHPLIASEEARLRLARAPEPWPAGTRLAAVSAVGPGGTSVHLVLRRDNGSGPRRRVRLPGGYAEAAARRPSRQPGAVLTGPAPPPAAEAFVFSGPDGAGVTNMLRRVAALAPWLSDAEVHDLACELAGRSAGTGAVRAALVASSPDELAERAATALTLLGELRPGQLATAPGVYAADGGQGRVSLLFPGDSALMAGPGGAAGGPWQSDPALHPAILASSLASLRLLDRLGVTPAAATGHGVGEITGLVWAGCLAELDAARLVAQRAALLSDPPAGGRTALVCVRADAPAALALCAGTGLTVAAFNGPSCQVLAGPAAEARDLVQRAAAAGVAAALLDAPLRCHTAALADRAAPLQIVLGEFGFRPPARRLVSTVTGRDLTAGDDLPETLCAQLTSPVRFAAALALAAADADLLVATGPGEELARLAAAACEVPAVTLAADRGKPEATAHAIAALFAAGATRSLTPLYAGRAARPIDLWAERTFITNPCETPMTDPAPAASGSVPRQSGQPASVAGDLSRAAASPSQASPGQAAQGPAANEPGEGGAAPAQHRGPDAGTATACQGGSSLLAGGEDPGLPVPGVAPWVRCFAEELRTPHAAAAAGAAGPWRVVAAGDPFGQAGAQMFEDDPAAGVVLAAAGDPASGEARAALLAAAREAAGSGRLVVMSPAGLSGFCASLHAEQPSLGITLIRTAGTPRALRAARELATAVPGQLRELVLDEAGSPRERVLAPAEPDWTGTYPLGPADVVLVSGMRLAGELASAGALGYRGAALAVLCEPGQEGDPRLSACLAELRAAGRRVWCESASLAEAEAVAAAVAELESGLGTVTAIVHGIAAGPAVPIGDLPGAAAQKYLSAEVSAFGNVLAAVRHDRLRLLLTFGSAAGRCGRPHGAITALASEAVAGYAARRGERLPGCRTLHIVWPGWPAGQPGLLPEAAGQQAVCPERAALLRQVLASPGLPGYLVVQGRGEAPQAVPDQDAGALAGRFLETVRVYHPGVELVAEARLSLPADPYLADYRIDGLPVLPAVLALEAMAEAGSALAGEPLRTAGQVSFAAPVVVGEGDGAGMVVRICALRHGDQVETVLRCAGTGFRLDHARAVFRASGGPVASLASGRTGSAGGSARPVSGRPQPARANPLARPPARGGGPAGGIVDGTDLYGPVCFQSGRFRRMAFLPEVTSGSCRALIRGGDDQPWFGAQATPPAAPLILGSPGVSDAALQVVQACLPHRRVLPASCESVVFGGQEVCGALQVHAIRRSPAGRGPGHRSGPQAAPAAIAGPSAPGLAEGASGVWDVIAVDAAGEPVVAWVGARLRDLGPLGRTAAWHPSLLAVSLESRAIEYGLDPSLRVVISTGQPLAGGHGGPPAAPGPPAGPGRPAAAAAAPPPDPGLQVPAQPEAGQPDAGQPDARQPDAGQPDAGWTDLAAGRGPLDGFLLTVQAAVPVAARWEPVGFGPDSDWPTGPAFRHLGKHLLTGRRETPDTVTARLRAVHASLAALGAQDQPAAIAADHDSGWIVIQAGRVLAATAVVEISGVPGLVAVAIAGTAPAPRAQPRAPAGRSGLAPMTA